MVLLGSVQRKELIKIIARQISRQKRLQVASKWQKEAQTIAFDQINTDRRPSRFEVIEGTDVSKLRELANNEMLPAHARRGKNAITHPIHEQMVHLPTRSILKNADSMTSTSTGYATITSSESHSRSPLDGIFPKSSSTLIAPDVCDRESMELLLKSNSTSINPAITKVKLVSIGLEALEQKELRWNLSLQPYERVMDMSPEDQQRWELAQLNEEIDFDQADIQIDPSPFQLVERTSISKVHGLFTMLGLRRAYVTQLGRLVGVVGVKELRSAIEDINNGHLTIEFRNIEPFPEVKPELLPQEDPFLEAGSRKSSKDYKSSTDSALSISDVVVEKH